MNEEYYKTLTPKFRAEINDSINKQLTELNTCSDNVLVNSQKVALKALQNIIDALPDGYLVPMRKN